MPALPPAPIVLAIVVCLGCQHIAPRPLAPERTAAALAARSLADPGLERFLAAARGHPVPVWPLPRWDLDSLTFAALYFQPDLEVARAYAEVARAAIESAAARPNPTLSLSPEISSNASAVASPWLAAVHLDWPIETAGKRRHRIDRAEAAAAAARAAVFTEAWRIRRQLASAVVALTAARGRCDSLVREVAVEGHLVALLEQRVEAGAASAVELAPVRFARLQSTRERAAACAQIGDLRAELAAALGVGSAAVEAIEVEALPPPEASPLFGLTPNEAHRRAVLERSDVRAALADYAAAEARLRLELARQYPDLHLGNGYQFDQGQNKWSVGLSIDLPVLDRNQGPIAEAAAARREAAARFVATQAHVLADVERTLARRAGAAAERAELTAAAADRGANLERVRSALRLGAADRVAELTAEIERGRAARAASDAEAALQQALVDLESVLEGPLATSETIERPGGDTTEGAAS